MSNYTPLSIFIREQLPSFVREDYQTFVRFVEAYYEYLEEYHNLTDFSRHLLQYDDVERTLPEFLEYFAKTYIPLIPKDTYTAKDVLIQHAKELYRTKGTPAAFKFLFRAVFGEEIDLYYGKDLVLRASDGKWISRQSLRVNKEFYSLTEGDGVTTQFRLFEICSTDTLSVYVNDVLQTSGFTLSLNDPIINFTTAPADGATIRFAYRSMNIANRINSDGIILQLHGQTSAATALSEEALVRYEVTGTYIEIFISHLSTTNFLQSERIRAKYYYTTADYLLLEFVMLTNVDSIIVVNPGASYNVGDVVPIIGGSPNIPATAVIDDVYQAIISRIAVLDGGIGYFSGVGVQVDPTPNGAFLALVSSVDSSGTVCPNTITLNTDVISLFENVVLSSADYGFTAPGSENVNSRLMDVLSFETLSGLGPVSNVGVYISTDEYLTAPNVTCNSPIYYYTSENDLGNIASSIEFIDLGIIGSVNIQSGGVGYSVGDEVVFTPPYNNFGMGAAGEVTQVFANTAIRQIRMRPSRISGTANTLAGIRLTIGSNTSFATELVPGDTIEINSESRIVSAILSNTELKVTSAWGKNTTKRHIGVYGKTFIGGQRYSKTYPPTVTVESINPLAYGAVLSVDKFFGEGCILKSFVDHKSGEIKSIAVTNRGDGYQSVPTIDLTELGNGLATALVQLFTSYNKYPGNFQTTDSLLSSDRKLQNKKYYESYSYTIFAPIDLTKYKDILLNLLHPSGMQYFGEVVFPLLYLEKKRNLYETNG